MGRLTDAVFGPRRTDQDVQTYARGVRRDTTEDEEQAMLEVADNLPLAVRRQLDRGSW